MARIKVWLQAARLRTLPLSFSGIITGSALAFAKGAFSFPIFLLALGCTLLFQVISNFANDYGDGIKGTDNNNRLGPKRMVQAGLLTPSLLKKGIILLCILAVGAVLILLYLSFGLNQWPYFLLFLALGILSIWAAITYTVGKDAYGYKGLGDIFVFVFFGLLGVMGSAFLYTRSFSLPDVLPAVVIGCLSVCVLNLNNMRDFENDAQSGKNTLVVKYGFVWAKKYHTALVLMAFVSAVGHIIFNAQHRFYFAHLVVFIPLLFHLIKVIKTTVPKQLDPELKKVALLTFFWSLLFFMLYNNLL